MKTIVITQRDETEENSDYRFHNILLPMLQHRKRKSRDQVYV